MSGEGLLFLEACEASGPLQLEWDDWEAGGTSEVTLGQASVLVGRNPAADLCLPHPSVGKRHAYLQIIEGRLYAIDLDSREGLHWSRVPRRSGWVDRKTPLQLGPTTIRLVGGDLNLDVEPGPSPLSRRFATRHPLPEVVLEIEGSEGGPKSWAMDQVLTLVGSSATCKIRLTGPGTSSFACALVRTRLGVWMVDLLSSRGVTINGFACSQARLEDGDILRISGQTIRLRYRRSGSRLAERSEVRPSRRDDVALVPYPIPVEDGSGAAFNGLSTSNWELIPELILREMQGQQGHKRDTSATVDQAVMLLVRLIGEVHREHLDVVREEMEQLRRLNREMGSLRAELPRSGRPDDLATGPGPASEGNQLPSPFQRLEPQDRPAPRMVQDRVTERLATWERERQSRWRKVMAFLLKP